MSRLFPCVVTPINEVKDINYVRLVLTHICLTGWRYILTITEIL